MNTITGKMVIILDNNTEDKLRKYVSTNSNTIHK